MRKLLKVCVLLVVAGLLGLAALTMNQTLSVKDEQARKIKRQPDLSKVHYIPVHRKLASPIDDKPTLIVLFHSECEHCQYEAEQLQQHSHQFTKTNVYLLTTETPARAYTFARRYGLDTLSMMHVGTLTQEEANQAFGPTSVPHVFIYGPDKHLRREFKGETTIESLIKYI